MNDFLNSIDRKKFWINVIGYLVVLFLSVYGPPMQGFMGSAIGAYLWLFPIYFVGSLYLAYRRGGGTSE